MPAPSLHPIETIRLPFPVPYYAQTASPEWTEAVFDRGVDPARDPRWREWDARSPEDYATWCGRACGAVCVKMCVEYLGGPVLPVMEWVRRGLAMAGYLVKTNPDGSQEEVGWGHAALAGLIDSAGLHAAALPANVERICAFLAAGKPVIASVSYELGTERPITHQGGHLIVVTGADLRSGQPLHLYVHNPSGRTQALRENACIAAGRFTQAFSGRIILASHQPITIADPTTAHQEQAYAEQ